MGEPGALALDSAAALWGWSDPPPEVVVLTDHARRPRPPDGVRLLRTRLIPQGWSRREGLLVTDRARTLADCLRFLPRSHAQDILDRSQLRGGPRLAQVAALLPSRGRGSGQGRLLLAAADGTASDGERKLAAILRRAGIRGWQANVRLKLRRMTVVVDFLFPELGLVLEVDGYRYHSKRDQFEHDRPRQNALFNAGYKVLRFTYRQIVDGPDAVLVDIMDALTI